VPENVKRWTFAPNARQRAVVVYDFVIDEKCWDHDAVMFRRLHMNLVSITGCAQPANI
jgi:hypothetical protein